MRHDAVSRQMTYVEVGHWGLVAQSIAKPLTNLIK